MTACLRLAGESRTFAGGVKSLKENGIEVIDMQSKECEEMLRTFIAAKPDVWNEDIGEAEAL